MRSHLAALSAVEMAAYLQTSSSLLVPRLVHVAHMHVEAVTPGNAPQCLPARSAPYSTHSTQPSLNRSFRIRPIRLQLACAAHFHPKPPTPSLSPHLILHPPSWRQRHAQHHAGLSLHNAVPGRLRVALIKLSMKLHEVVHVQSSYPLSTGAAQTFAPPSGGARRHPPGPSAWHSLRSRPRLPQTREAGSGAASRCAHEGTPHLRA